MFLRKFFYSSVTLFSLTVSSLSLADNNMRKLFKDAEKAIWSGNYSKYQTLNNQLHYYTLQPYLTQQYLLKTMDLSKSKEINDFLQTHRATPLDWPLRKKWLQYLAKKKQKLLFVDAFIANSDAALNCHYLTFELDLKRKKEREVMSQVTKLWQVGKSQPKVCDKIFKQWQSSGYQTQDVVWNRMVKAGDGGDHTLIRYLTTLLEEDKKYLGNLWKKTRANPAYISKLNRFPAKTAQETRIVSYGLKRLIWRNPSLALTTYQKAKKLFPFTEQDLKNIDYKFAIALAAKNHEQADVWLANVDSSLIDHQVVQWRINFSLKNQNWQKVIAVIEKLPTEIAAKHQWQYWYGKALLEIGQQNKGDSILSALSETRHYYGFMAASLVGKPVSYRHNPAEIANSEKQNLLKSNAAKRAIELFNLERFNLARREWNYWMATLTNTEKIAAAHIAYDHHWYDRAIFTLAEVGYLDDVEKRFPLAYQDKLENYANNNNINPTWAMAITRRESSFMSDAHSSAGARGLMQVLPSTAKQLAKKKKLPNQYLMNADNNIALGTKYLKKLLDRYDGNKVLATASYNAGPYRVKTWLKQSSQTPADIWIETIPYKETREYVKSVLAYQQIYQSKVGKKENIFNELISMKIGG